LARTGLDWTLYCLWFEIPGTTAVKHRKDLESFIDQLRGDARHFSALTYQDFFQRLQPLLSAHHADYMKYMSQRYL
jgi:hypothetical protein